VLTSPALITVDYIPPPAAIGNLCLFPHGTGQMHFADGRRDPNRAVGLMTPLSRATPVVVEGPFHAFGAALTPLGWAALTGLHAGQHRDRPLPAASVFGLKIEALGNRLIAADRAGSLCWRDCAREIGGFLTARALARKYRVLPAGPQLSLAEAAALGKAYFDQSHMIREIVRFIGRTPARLAGKATPYLAEMIAPTNLRELEV